MKQLFFLMVIFCCPLVNAQTKLQIKTPTKVSYSVIDKGKKKEINIIIHLEPHWHIYSQNPGKGPVATQVVFDKNPLITMIGNTQEVGNKIEKFDKAFDATLSFYEQTLTLIQEVVKKSTIKTELKGYVYFMVCDDSKCLPPTKEYFSILIQ